MKVGDRVVVTAGHGFGGPGCIKSVCYIVEMDHNQPAGGKIMTVDAYHLTKIDKKARRK